MKAAIIIVVVGIILIVSSIIEWNQTNKRIKELEQRLTHITGNEVKNQIKGDSI